MTDSATTQTATLSCQHSMVVAAGVAVGDKIGCLKCKPSKTGGQPAQRTVKKLRPSSTPESTDAVVVDESELIARRQAVVSGKGKAVARVERYEQAKAAAKAGEPVDEVLAQPLPDPSPGDHRPRRKADNGRVTFFHLSPARTAALRLAGQTIADDATTVDIMPADMARLLEMLPSVAADESKPKSVRTAATKAIAWLEKF